MKEATWFNEENNIESITKDNLLSSEVDSIYYPAVKVKELKNKYLVKIELPLRISNGIETSVCNGILRIRKNDSFMNITGPYNLKQKHKEPEIYRDITFDTKVNGKNIKRSYKNGYLCLDVYKENND